MILMVVVAVAVAAVVGPAVIGTAATTAGVGGATVTAAATGLTATLGATGAAIVGGGIAAAAGSIASQAFGLATGIQDKFSWKGVALAAISGGVGGGLGKLIPGGGILAGAARGAAGSAITQGVAVATGLQHKFDWTGVAVGGIVGGTMGGMGVDYSDRSLGGYATQAAAGMAGAIVGGATRSLIDGTDFGDNIMAALPDVIGNTIGNLAAEEIATARENAWARKVNERFGLDNSIVEVDDGIFAKFLLSSDSSALSGDIGFGDLDIRRFVSSGKDFIPSSDMSSPDQDTIDLYNDAIGRQTGKSLFVGPFAIQGGDLAQRYDAAKHLQEILTTKRGQYFRAQAIDSSRQERIIVDPKFSDYARGDYNFGVAIYNPVTLPNLAIQTTRGWRDQQVVPSLAHELGHVFSRIRDIGPGQMRNVNLNENPIRRELGYPERISYGKYQIINGPGEPGLFGNVLNPKTGKYEFGRIGGVPTIKHGK